MRIKFGITAWSTLSAMLLSLVMISGCNEEPASTTTPGGGAAPGAGKPAEGGKMAPAAPPAPTKPEEKKP